MYLPISKDDLNCNAEIYFLNILTTKSINNIGLNKIRMSELMN